jgi:hypothetical protein
MALRAKEGLKSPPPLRHHSRAGTSPDQEIYESRVILNEAAPGKACGPVVCRTKATNGLERSPLEHPALDVYRGKSETLTAGEFSRPS